MASLALLHFRRLGRRGSFLTPLYPYLAVAGMAAILAVLIGLAQRGVVLGVVMMLVLLRA